LAGRGMTCRLGAAAADLAARGYAAWNLSTAALAGGGWPETFEDVAAGIDLLARLPVDTSGWSPWGTARAAPGGLGSGAVKLRLALRALPRGEPSRPRRELPGASR